MMAQTGRFLEM